MFVYLPSEASPGYCSLWPPGLTCLPGTDLCPTLLGWSTSFVTLPVLRDAQIAGKTSFLGVSGRAFLEQISIWISRLSKYPSFPVWDKIIQFIEDLNWLKGRGKENWFSTWAGTSIFPCPQTSVFLLLRFWDLDSPGPQAFGSGWVLHHWLYWDSGLQMRDCGSSQPK